MLLVLFSLILIINRIDSRFLLNSGSSSVIVSRLIRIPTDDDEYRIRCPYNLNYIMITALNYSNQNCSELNSVSIHNPCSTRRSPCRFQSRPILLSCDDSSYSTHVDITYQCSFSPIALTNFPRSTKNKQNQITSEITNSTRLPHTVTRYVFPLKNAEGMAFFLVGIGVIFILWLFACCIWFIHCGNTFDGDDGKCELLAHRPFHMSDMLDFDIIPEENLTVVGSIASHTSTGGLENLCLRINPLDESNLSLTYVSSLRTTRTDR